MGKPVQRHWSAYETNPKEQKCFESKNVLIIII